MKLAGHQGGLTMEGGTTVEGTTVGVGLTELIPEGVAEEEILEGGGTGVLAIMEEGATAMEVLATEEVAEVLSETNLLTAV